MRRGEVRCAQSAKRGIKGSRDATAPGFRNIRVISADPTWSPLSPMKLGPLNVYEPIINGVIHPGFRDFNGKVQVGVCQIYENFWQYSKVYSVDTVTNGIPSQSFFDRRAKGFASTKPKRRVYPKKDGVIPITSYHNGELVPYIPSREVYVRRYAELAYRHPKYRELENMVNGGMNLLIIGLDGIPNGENIPLSLDLLDKEYIDPSHPFGHESVIAAMLAGMYIYRPSDI